MWTGISLIGMKVKPNFMVLGINNEVEELSS